MFEIDPVKEFAVIRIGRTSGLLVALEIRKLVNRASAGVRTVSRSNRMLATIVRIVLDEVSFIAPRGSVVLCPIFARGLFVDPLCAVGTKRRGDLIGRKGNSHATVVSYVDRDLRGNLAGVGAAPSRGG